MGFNSGFKGLILSGIRSNCLSSGKEMIIVPIDKKGDKTVYPAFLVILLVTGNIEGGAGWGGMEMTGKICQIEITENSLFY